MTENNADEKLKMAVGLENIILHYYICLHYLMNVITITANVMTQEK